MLRPSFLVALASLLAAGPALAQTAAPAPGSESAIPEKQGAPLNGGEKSGNLSSKLSETGGVIHPKTDVDPGMHVPAPDPHPNSTPVIPPSATGGNSAK